MSPALNESSAIGRFKHSHAIEIRDGITLDFYTGMPLILFGGAYARDKNTSARLCPKNAGGAYARVGAFLRDTTVYQKTKYVMQQIFSQNTQSKKQSHMYIMYAYEVHIIE